MIKMVGTKLVGNNMVCVGNKLDILIKDMVRIEKEKSLANLKAENSKASNSLLNCLPTEKLEICKGVISTELR